MPELTLVMGNRNYSSWSLRGWLALEQTGLPYGERTIWFDEDKNREQRRAYSPTGRVPVLLHGDVVIWDSLAIAEYLAELAPDAGLWPTERAARARARVLCAEMHSGFPAVRAALPFNLHGRVKKPRTYDAAVNEEIDRLRSMWTETRRAFGQGGPFLFGKRCLADAFYAPVAGRFRTYAVDLEGEAAAWAETVLSMPAMQDWAEKARTEGHPDYADDALLEDGGR